MPHLTRAAKAAAQLRRTEKRTLADSQLRCRPSGLRPDIWHYARLHNATERHQPPPLVMNKRKKIACSVVGLTL